MKKEIIWTSKPLPTRAALIATGFSFGLFLLSYASFYPTLPSILKSSIGILSLLWPLFTIFYIGWILPVRLTLYSSGVLEHRDLFKNSTYPIQKNAKYTLFQNMFIGHCLHFNNHASTMLFGLNKKSIEDVTPLIDQFLAKNGPSEDEKVWTVDPLPPLQILGPITFFTFALTIAVMFSPFIRSFYLLNLVPFIFIGLTIHLVNHQFFTHYTLFKNGTLYKKTLFSNIYYQMRETTVVSQHLSIVGSKHVQFADGRQMRMDYIPEFDEVCKSLNSLQLASN